MKKYLLFLATLFIIWLFLATVLYYNIQNRNKYSFHKSDVPPSIILNNQTGETYRYFVNMDENGKMVEQGWGRLLYSTPFGISSRPEVSKEMIINFVKSGKRIPE